MIEAIDICLKRFIRRSTLDVKRDSHFGKIFPAFPPTPSLFAGGAGIFFPAGTYD
jgi:hypothetical protein